MDCLIIRRCTVVLLVVLPIVSCEIPEYIQVCPHNHENLSACIINSIDNLRPRLKAGIPELDIPPLEPFQLDPITIKSSGSATRIATLTNLQLWGVSNFKILKLTPKATKTGHSFRYSVQIPRIHMEAEYEIDSKLLFLNLQGRGPFNANITNYQFECIMNGNKEERDGIAHLVFERLKCIIGLERATVYLDNLFNGNPVLVKATNDAINDNSGIFFEEIKPSIQIEIEEKFTDISNKITSTFAYDELFP